MDGNTIANLHLAFADEVLSSIAKKKLRMLLTNNTTNLVFDVIVTIVSEEKNMHKNKKSRLIML